MSSFFSSKKYQRVFLWTLIILFVLSLPNAIILYRSANRIMSVSNVGRIPFIIFLFLFLITAVYIRLSNRNFSVKRFFPLLILSVIIWTAVPIFEANSNKYIHIPEYMVLSILVYVALSIDYSGSGILFFDICPVLYFRDCRWNTAGLVSGQVLWMEGHGHQFVRSITWYCFDKRHDISIYQGLELASADFSK